MSELNDKMVFRKKKNITKNSNVRLAEGITAVAFNRSSKWLKNMLQDYRSTD